MAVFEIYTLGSGVYLEKILNAIVMITHGTGDKNPLNFVFIMKFASICSVLILAVRAGINNDFKSAIKWFASVTVLVSLFLTAKAEVWIHDGLPDSYGNLSAPRNAHCLI
jgi:conjugal transfer mating pair stabilization protein TraG